MEVDAECRPCVNGSVRALRGGEGRRFPIGKSLCLGDVFGKEDGIDFLEGEFLDAVVLDHVLKFDKPFRTQRVAAFECQEIVL